MTGPSGITTERILQTLLVGAIAFGCIVVLTPLSESILWAAVITYTTWPVFRFLRRRMKPVPASLSMVALCSVCVVMPLAFLASTIIAVSPRWAEKLMDIFSVQHTLPPLPGWLTQLPMVGHELSKKWIRLEYAINHLRPEIGPYADKMVEASFALFMQLASGALHLVMALFISFFFWLSGLSMVDALHTIATRIAGRHGERHLHLIGGTVRGTVYGILGTAIIQGLLTGIGFRCVALPDPVMFGVIAFFLAVLPIGAPLLWVPAGIWLMADHQIIKSIFLLLFGIIFISGADHIIRPFFIARGAKMPYLLTIMGVIGGVVSFGALGVFIGPVLLAVGYTLTIEYAGRGPSSLMSESDSRSVSS
ncbi:MULTISPECIES: AI-2E family transporter [Acetobacter]|uniref:AI-2E family transporter n=1 Tax=Acetobacter thailandicus TaxID=1502842 RepID=A0ABT3QFX4_9PROT|nr:MULTISPECIES: AI-2E family transporter [Acetobacter]MBS0959640.1 AI-2E family transporter [Acetobacter thailandicus]MBS0979909.1 AI-2E family transporter [Acetobacter thailandicus]MBS1002771.1 AI-2E family transporter [Acetobacter thailandicus]MCX2564190.1 AI-2E family transporter [Acetobacter thailandicus]NHN95534.1 AI-2E family transporter [Acetobacter thailandicus]